MGNAPTDDKSAPSAPGANLALMLLLIINLFNYIDRQVLSAVITKIQDDGAIFAPGAESTQTRSGLLTSAFLVTYMLLSPVFARFGDRSGRWLVIGGAVIFWSLASGSSGLALSYGMLLATRCLVGVGEAAYGPIAPAMLSDLYPEKRRGKVFTLFYLAIPVGSALGYILGGQIAALAGSWRAAFWATYTGSILGLLCLFMKEPSHIETAMRKPRMSYRDAIKSLRRIRTFVFTCAGMIGTTFMMGGVAVFVPIYVFQHEAKFEITSDSFERMRQAKVPENFVTALTAKTTAEPVSYQEFRSILTEITSHNEELAKQYTLHSSAIVEAATAPGSLRNDQITFRFGIIMVVCGLAATFLGGLVGDFLRDRGWRGAYLKVSGITALLAWPSFLGLLYAPFPLAWLFVALAVFFLFFNTGPANTVLANVVTSDLRATAFAINILIIHLFGDVPSPSIIGLIADLSNLKLAFLVVSFSIPAAGILWLLGSTSQDQDTRTASEIENWEHLNRS